MSGRSDPLEDKAAPRDEGARDRPLWRRLLAYPRTRAGWWSIGFVTACAVFLVLFWIFVAAGQRGGDTFFSNPSLWVTIVISAASAVAGGVAAAVAIFWKRENSLLVVFALLCGLLVFFFIVGELGGHD